MFLVDPQTAQLMPVSRRAAQADDARSDDEDQDVAQELYLEQIETNTEPSASLADLRRNALEARKRASEDAAEGGAALLAVSAPLLDHDGGHLTPKDRYRRMAELNGVVSREALVCGMHVHVDVEDEQEGVRVIDGLAPWLPLLLALSAGSPFLRGEDTGFASWRHQAWDGWATSGPVEPFGDVASYRSAVERLVASGAALDEGMVYFDVRLPRDLPTVEVRVADVCTDVDDAMVVAALARALVDAVATGVAQTAPWRVELLRGARWAARRHGLTGHLLDPVDGRPVPAAEAVARLLETVDDSLGSTGDRAVVHAGVQRLLDDGGPAQRQRDLAGSAPDLDALARHLLERTVASLP